MKILLVGVSVRALAASAVQSGCEIVALDAFGDLDLQALCEGYSLKRDFGKTYSAQALISASRKLQFEAAAYTASFENYPSLVGAVGKRGLLLGNPPEVLRRVRNWSELFEKLEAAHIRVPETYYSLNGRRPDPQRTWLRKPQRGGGGQHIEIWREGQPIGRGQLLQECLEGTVCSALFVANGHEAVLLGLTEQLVGRPEFGAQGFMYCGNVLPLHTGNGDTAVLEQASQITRLLTRQFGLVGVNGVDFILSKGEIYPIEVNPRYTAAMELVERAYGLPVFELHVRAVTHGELPGFDLAKASVEGHGFHAKTILYAKKNGRAPDTQSWIQRGLRDVPHRGEALLSGRPICTILTSAETRTGCLSNLAVEAEAIKGEIND